MNVTLPNIAALLALVLAAVALAGRGRSLGRAMFAAGMAALAVESYLSGRSANAFAPTEAAFWQEWRLLVMAVLPGLWSLFSLCYSRGNHLEFVRRWWVWITLSVIGPLLLAFLYQDGLVLVIPPAADTGRYVTGLGPAGKALHVFALLSWVFVLLNLERTFRTAVGTMRWRIKFAVVGLAVLFGTRVYCSSQAFLYSAVASAHVNINACALILACVLIVISVVRTRTFEIDVYPSQTLLYNSLTILLAGLYLLVVGVMAKWIEAWGGDGSFPLTAAVVLVALVGLGLLGLSDRVRLRLRRFVSRHFHRPLHDYRRLWSAFSERTATLVDRTEFGQAAVRLMSETFEALSVSIWLVDEARGTLAWGASTTWSEDKAGEALAGLGQAGQVLEALRDHAAPFDFDRTPTAWAETLRRLQPDQFGKGGGRYAVPLRANGELLGLITVGDRVSGLPFEGQDLDLLKCMADQIAATLLNQRLSRRLLESKQMEAFQAMSTFFVHDLKNAASTLSLTLGNLRVHFDNPEFRQDALRAIGRTSDRINALIGRLALLRQGLELKLTEASLNEVVQAALQALEAGAASVELKLDDVPRTRLDAGQMQRVVVNFLMNAREASGPKGHIQVHTTRRNGWVSLAVTDNGCGMTPEFISQNLFRPFQTTKSRGLGIGLFQAKVIVEAHRGRIEVESAPGHGTTFRILLPTESVSL
jgi:putative PEP-CTERM system histidine kinase